MKAGCWRDPPPTYKYRPTQTSPNTYTREGQSFCEESTDSFCLRRRRQLLRCPPPPPLPTHNRGRARGCARPRLCVRATTMLSNTYHTRRISLHLRPSFSYAKVWCGMAKLRRLTATSGGSRCGLRSLQRAGDGRSEKEMEREREEGRERVGGRGGWGGEGGEREGHTSWRNPPPESVSQNPKPVCSHSCSRCCATRSSDLGSQRLRQAEQPYTRRIPPMFCRPLARSRYEGSQPDQQAMQAQASANSTGDAPSLCFKRPGAFASAVGRTSAMMRGSRILMPGGCHGASAMPPKGRNPRRDSRSNDRHA